MVGPGWRRGNRADAPTELLAFWIGKYMKKLDRMDGVEVVLLSWYLVCTTFALPMDLPSPPHMHLYRWDTSIHQILMPGPGAPRFRTTYEGVLAHLAGKLFEMRLLALKTDSR